MVARLADEKDLAIHVNVYNDLGVIYRRRNMNDSALHYYHKALNAAVTLDDKEWLTTLAHGQDPPQPPGEETACQECDRDCDEGEKVSIKPKKEEYMCLYII